MSNLTVTFFEYNGAIGAEIDIDKGTFLNDPKAPGQMGTVTDVKYIGMPEEVKQAILTRYKREGGSFASMMISKSSKEDNIGLLGGYAACLATSKTSRIQISRDCDLSVLDSCIKIENNPPQDFKDYIDSLPN